MKNTILNVDARVFLVKMQFTITNGKFMFQSGADLMNILKGQDGHRGIEYIKVFDDSKARFKRVSKANLLEYFSWETEAIEYLKNHSFFK